MEICTLYAMVTLMLEPLTTQINTEFSQMDGGDYEPVLQGIVV